jgi:hypothetical protein
MNPYDDHINESPRKYCFKAILPIYTTKNLTKQTYKSIKALRNTLFQG